MQNLGLKPHILGTFRGKIEFWAPIISFVENLQLPVGILSEMCSVCRKIATSGTPTFLIYDRRPCIELQRWNYKIYWTKILPRDRQKNQQNCHKPQQQAMPRCVRHGRAHATNCQLPQTPALRGRAAVLLLTSRHSPTRKRSPTAAASRLAAGLMSVKSGLQLCCRPTANSSDV